MKSKTARVSEKIESAIRSAIKYYEEQHDLEWCDGSYDADEIKEAAEMLLSLHKRAKEWIRMHRALLPEGGSQNGEYFDDDFDGIDNEQVS